MTTLSWLKTRTSAHFYPIVGLILLFLLLGVGLGRHWLEPALAQTPTGVNVTDRVSVVFSGLRLNRATGTFDSIATLTNHSTGPAPAPLQLVLTGITPPSVTLANATGTTPENLPYLIVPVVNDRLEPGATATVTLRFANPNRVTFTFTHQVFGSPPNTPPVANAGQHQTVALNTTVTLNGGASTDADRDPLTYHWSLAKPTGSTATLSDPNVVNPTFPVDLPGQYVATLIVNDGQVDSEPVTVTISTLNSAPIAHAGLDQSVALGSLVTLHGGDSSDPDNDPLTYQWSLTPPAGSAAVLDNPFIAEPSFTADKPGQYTGQLVVNDGHASSAPDTVIVSTQNSKPVANAGPDQTVTVGSPVHLNGRPSSDADGNPLTYQWSFTSYPGEAPTLTDPQAATPSFTPTQTGLYIVQLIVNDGQVNSEPDTVQVTVEAPLNHSPQITSTPVTTATVGQSYSYPVTATDADGDTLSYALNSAPQGMTIGANSGQITWTPATAGTVEVSIQVSDGKGGSATQSYSITVGDGEPPLPPPPGPIPPDPATVAPPIDPTVVTTMADSTSFLYSGSNPIQTGVPAGAIEEKRVAVIRGKVFTRNGSPLPGVTITILNHPEFGQTLSRADGAFDLAVNGGGVLTVNYERAGYLPAQRQVQTPWQDYAFAPDVSLVTLDPVVTAVNLTMPTDIQVAHGSPSTDGDGTRRATLLFPAGTTATIVLADGTTQSLPTLNVRATEYTIGPGGPQAMPAKLPPTSGYTYAVEVSADESRAAGATSVVLSQPIPFYVENFLGFPVGTAVPAGYYDRQKGQWIAAPNGRVIKVVAINGGLADLDTNGDGSADTAEALAALGITDAERAKLATLYSAGQSLWRAPLDHFTPWDFNWPYGLPAGAGGPTKAGATGAPSPGCGTQKPAPTQRPGSSIGCETQALGEAIPITGTPFTLHYQSERTPGYQAGRTFNVNLTESVVPPGVKSVRLTVEVAGKRDMQTFAPTPNQRIAYTWDGRDIYGRPVRGGYKATVTVSYVYNAVYYVVREEFTRSFALASGLLTAITRQGLEIGLEQTSSVNLDASSSGGEPVAGWNLSAHHRWDAPRGVLIRGDGTETRADAFGGAVISTVAGNGVAGFSGDGGPATAARLNLPTYVAVGADGSLYITDFGNSRIRRVGPDGIISTVAGNGVAGFSGDGGPATAASLFYPYAISVAADGSLYIGDEDNHRIRRVGPNGIITTVVGNGVADFSGDGGSATAASLKYPIGVAVAADGGLYIGDHHNHRIRRVGPDGIITTVAGNGIAGFSGDGGPATAASLHFPMDVAVADGSLYVSEYANQRIRRVGPDGIISTVAGNGAAGFSGDGGPATEASLNIPHGVAVATDGNLYFADENNHRIRRVGSDGIISTVAGNGAAGFSGDGGPAAAARLDGPVGIAVAADGSLYIGDELNHRIRRVAPGNAGYSLFVPSSDGTEVYEFDLSGRHLRTRDALTGGALYTFSYDAKGRLVSITDSSGNVTTIERDGAGNPTAIVSPFGQRTELTLDANGYLASISNPAGETHRMQYTANGLLTRFENPRQHASVMTYDNLGRLVQDANAAGGSQVLTRQVQEDPPGTAVTVTTAEGPATTYKVEDLTTGEQRRTITQPDGARTVAVTGADGKMTSTRPDGTTSQTVAGPDPRFGMAAPVTTNQTVRTPSGLITTIGNGRTANLTNPNDPLSLVMLTDTFTVNGRTSSSVYTAATRTRTTTSAANRQTTTLLDTLGRPARTQTAGLEPVAYAYDARGHLETLTQGSGANARAVTFTYDTTGYLAGITDALGRSAGFAYDTAGRVTRQTFPDGREVQFGYDAKGNLTSLIPPGRPAHTFTYTPVDLTATYVPPDVGAGANRTGYSYNLDKQLTRVTRPDGKTAELGYDTAGRLSTLTIPDGVFTYGYQAATGHLNQINAPDGGTLAFSYDGSLLTGATWTGSITGSVGFSYDNDFRVTSVTVNGANSMAYQYDADSLLTKAGNLTLSRNAQNGLLTGAALGSVSDSLSYDGFGEVTDYTAKYSGATLLSTQFSYDKLGRITQKIETVQGDTDTYDYSYDLAGRLERVKRNGTTISVYNYDANGNRLSHTAGGATVNGSYDAQDRLLSYGGAVYTYTANGELKTKTAGGQATDYSYDVLGNLKQVKLPDGRQIDYLVDAQNRRIGKKMNGALAQGFLWQDQLKPIAELDGSGSIVSRFVYATHVNVPDYMIRGGNTYRLITDHLGSPRLVVNIATGAIAQRLDYDEFGNVLTDTNPGFQPFGFAGGLYDRDTGLVRFGARDYEAEVGRWLAKDPVRFAADDGNLFNFVTGDPLNRSDPSGKQFQPQKPGCDGVPDFMESTCRRKCCDKHDDCYTKYQCNASSWLNNINPQCDRCNSEALTCFERCNPEGRCIVINEFRF